MPYNDFVWNLEWLRVEMTSHATVHSLTEQSKLLCQLSKQLVDINRYSNFRLPRSVMSYPNIEKYCQFKIQEKIIVQVFGERTHINSLKAAKSILNLEENQLQITLSFSQTQLLVYANEMTMRALYSHFSFIWILLL